MTEQTVGVGLSRSEILTIFELESTGHDFWRSCRVDPRGGRMFGGSLVGQALAAAQYTAPYPASATNLIVNFYRPADGGLPCDYRVGRVYDGRSSASRIVTVTQGGEVLATATAAFTVAKPFRAQCVSRNQPVVAPEDLPATGMPHPARAVPQGSFDIRFYDTHDNGTFIRRLWFKALDPLPAEAIAHQCTVVFISDLYFFDPIFAQHGLPGKDNPSRHGATTQHCVWFHTVPSADNWLVIESMSPAVAGGRGIVTGQIRTYDGHLVATVVQEVAVRFPAPIV